MPAEVKVKVPARMTAKTQSVDWMSPQNGGMLESSSSGRSSRRIGVCVRLLGVIGKLSCVR